MKYYLQLMRPANLVTSVADIIAGIALSGITFSSELPFLHSSILLCISTIGLYGGGVVFNDIFDAKLDAIERPERPIPSGKITLKNAVFLGIFLLCLGLISAYIVNKTSFAIALFIAICALYYDKFGKHNSFWGPINMGLCRGGNLLLGLSIIPAAVIEWYWIAIIPVIYIAAITIISRSEVHGGSKTTLYLAAVLYITINICQLFVSERFNNLILALPFILLHIVLIFMPLSKAVRNPIGPNIGKAVKAGVLALIVMDAAWVAMSGNLFAAIAVLILLPISIYIAKAFAVT